MQRFILPIGLAIAPVLTAAVTKVAAAECELSVLTAATDSYVEAQAAGGLDTFTTLAEAATYTENFKEADFAAGILSQPLKIDLNRSLHDPVQCATYTEIIVTDRAHPYVLGTQMWLTDGKVSKMETLVTDRGDWLFNATGTMYWAAQEDWGEIPEEARDTRETIQAAADAYADIFLDKTVTVPWGEPGGAYTGNGSPTDRCDVGIPSGVNNTNRRYVIDVSKGAVDMFMTFADSLPDSHEFRLEGGKLRYVHTLTVM